MVVTYLVGISGGKVEIDSEKYLVGISLPHHKVHEGIHYSFSDVDTDVDISGPKYWRLTTPDNDIEFHITIGIAASAGVTVELFENPTISGAGTALSIYNNDRRSGNTTTATAFYDSTTSADGTLIYTTKVGSAGPGVVQRIGGNTRNEAEWILKHNEDYLVKVTADADNTEVILNVEFYEA